MLNREQKIKEILQKNLNPQMLEVLNFSHLHKGHMGDDGSSQTHFKITIKSEQLQALNRMQAHQVINRLLADEFKQGLHALEIKIL